MRIGLIGAGYMGRQHARALTQVPGADLVCIAGAEAQSSRAAELANACGASATDLETMLADDTIDAVIITTPTATHADLACAALRAGKHVLCETPLAADAATAREMLAAAEESERMLQVALVGRFADPGAWVRQHVRDGTIGAPERVSTYRRAPGTSGAHHGDVLEEILLFDLDWVRWTLGDPARIEAQAFAGDDDRLDHAAVRLTYDDLVVRLEGSYLEPVGHPMAVGAEVRGTDGWIAIDLRLPGDGPPSVDRRIESSTGETQRDTTLGAEPVSAEVAHFIAVLRGEADGGLLHAREAVASLELLDAARAAVDVPAS